MRLSEADKDKAFEHLLQDKFYVALQLETHETTISRYGYLFRTTERLADHPVLGSP